jgi:hypothetical protein
MLYIVGVDGSGVRALTPDDAISQYPTLWN